MRQPLARRDRIGEEARGFLDVRFSLSGAMRAAGASRAPRRSRPARRVDAGEAVSIPLAASRSQACASKPRWTISARVFSGLRVRHQRPREALLSVGDERSRALRAGSDRTDSKRATTLAERPEPIAIEPAAFSHHAARVAGAS
jgi:hypothetical protein